MLKNPFHKKKSLSEKVETALHLHKTESNQAQLLKKIQQTFLFISLFLAGYIVAKLEFLMK